MPEKIPSRPMGRPPKWEAERPIVEKLLATNTPYTKITELTGVPESTIRSWVKKMEDPAA